MRPMRPPDPEDGQEDVEELVDAPDFEEDAEEDAPILPEGLGALGQLAAGVIVVAVLLAAFIFGSALLRRLFG
jgi:hypothetical protein